MSEWKDMLVNIVLNRLFSGFFLCWVVKNYRILDLNMKSLSPQIFIAYKMTRRRMIHLRDQESNLQTFCSVISPLILKTSCISNLCSLSYIIFLLFCIVYVQAHTYTPMCVHTSTFTYISLFPNMLKVIISLYKWE